MKIFRWAYLAFALALGAGASVPSVSAAANCDFRDKGFVALEDRTILVTLRCLVNELDKLKRENAALRERLDEVEGVMTELPSTYVNVDGEVTQEEGRAIGRASYTLSARSSGGANALPIDQAVLEEVCSKTGGCSVAITFKQLSLFDGGAKDGVLAGPCQFTYSAETQAWSIGAGCGGDPASGVDGDQLATAESGSDPVIVSSSDACILSESEPARGVGQDNGFARDHRKGLFLVAIPWRQANGIRRFQCEVVFD